MLIVARISKNLQGGCVKELKTAAVMATAALEVLRTRAENDKDTDVSRQMRALKNELKTAKQNAARANEEILKLQAEVAKLQAKKDRRRQSTRVIISNTDSDSPAERENRTRRKETKKPTINDEKMEIDSEAVEDPPQIPIQEREYNDERKKKEILPPQEEWPQALRPPIQGKIKVLEDRVLVGHKVKVTSVKNKQKEENKEMAKISPPEANRDDSTDGVQKILNSLTPALENWLSNSLKAYGIERKPKTAGDKQKATPAVKDPQVLDEGT